jgi:hypothetical protein
MHLIFLIAMTVGVAFAPPAQDSGSPCDLLRRMVEQPELVVDEALIDLEREGEQWSLPPVPSEERRRYEALLASRARELTLRAIVIARSGARPGDYLPPQTLTGDRLWDTLLGVVLGQWLSDGEPLRPLDAAMRRVAVESLSQCGLSLAANPAETLLRRRVEREL